MTNELPRHFPFLTFKTKQNVSRSKLGREFAKKGWKDFSTSFSENVSVQVEPTSFATEEELIEKKIDLEIPKKHKFAEGCNTSKRNPSIERKDYFSSKANNFCNLVQKKSLQSENKKTHNLNKCQNSIFLEVQNIQDSFQNTKLTHESNFHVKSSFEFITSLATKKDGGHKKNGVSAYQFIVQENDFPHSVPVRKAQKTNVVSDFYSFIKEKNAAVISNLSEPIRNSKLVPSYRRKNLYTIKNDVHFQVDAEEVDENQNKNASFILSEFLLDASSKNKGSSWLQSLQTSDIEVAPEDAAGTRIRNILPGGFAEQMLKLQRIEKSERVIWDHNVYRKKRRGKSLQLMLMSASSSSDIIIANCLSLQTVLPEICIDNRENRNETHSTGVAEFSSESEGSERVVVLLKKSVFNKLHLKIQSIFHLYPPWQALHLPGISCPLILSAKFIDLNTSESNLIRDKISYSHPRLLSLSSSSVVTSYQASDGFNENFSQWRQPKSLCVRIQRIWKIHTRNAISFASISNYFRYSLLIQDQYGVFYELMLSSTHFLPYFWKEFISQAEGKCYEFQNLHVIHRLCLRRFPQLLRVLDSISVLQNDGKCLKQEFYHQLTFHGCSVIPKAVSDEGFPAYYSLLLQPLSSLFEEMNSQRFTCIGKLIFQFKETLYLCDDSIPKYVPLESLFPVPPLDSSLVLIRDAQWLEGCLLLDNYSSLVQLSQMKERLKELCEHQLTNVNLQNVIPFVSENSKFVFIAGEIIEVDENSAISWLQCDLCFSEKLVQDSNLVIYCESCFHIVPKPVLSVKMSVICQCSSHVKAEVELLSSTIKRILQISDDTHQPQCKIGDVLGKQIGPLLCCIKSSTTVGGVKQLQALEVDTHF